VRWIQEGGSIKRDEAGARLASGISIDVTELKQAEEAMRNSERLARGQLDALAEMLEVLAAERDPDQLPRTVANTIQSQLGAVSTSIWVRNEDRLDLLGVAEDGRFLSRNEAGFFDDSIPINGPTPPLWTEGLKSGSHLLIDDLDKEPTRVTLGDGRTTIWRQSDIPQPFAKVIRRIVQEGVCGALIAPLLLAGELAGFVGIRFKSARNLGPGEIELTKALAHQAMLAIQLMRLSQQSRRSAVIAERIRLARDIHDTLAHGLTGIIVQLEAAQDAESRGLGKEMINHVVRASNLAREGLKEARRSVQALRPQSLENNDLPGALEALINKMTTGTRIVTKLVVDGTPRRLPDGVEENLLRIMQEALTNALRHASANHLLARLAYELNRVRLEFVDNGSGFDPAASDEGFGLTGMKERVEDMGGHIVIESGVGTGATISISVPA